MGAHGKQRNETTCRSDVLLQTVTCAGALPRDVLNKRNGGWSDATLRLHLEEGGHRNDAVATAQPQQFYSQREGRSNVIEGFGGDGRMREGGRRVTERRVTRCARRNERGAQSP
jgi:hypothetical protein